jgi:hypothetical protein
MLQRAAYLDAMRMQVLHWTKPAAGSYLLAEVCKLNYCRNSTVWTSGMEKKKNA